MYSHPHFDLFLHTDEELNELMGERITTRETLHEWPLSCVQRLTLATGQTCIYKAQSGPTVEPEFYAAAHSALLPFARTLYRDSRYACMAFEDVSGQALEQMPLNLRTALDLGRAVMQQIAGITGDAPVYLDVSTWERWQAIMSAMLEDLNGLVSTGKFEVTRGDDVLSLSRAVNSEAIRGAYDRAASSGGIGLIHNDLNADNILLPGAGRQAGKLKVIDWQRPIRGLREIDLALLLTSLGFDPRPHLAPGVVAATNLLRAHWLVEASITWFTPGVKTYDQAIAGIAAASRRVG